MKLEAAMAPCVSGSALFPLQSRHLPLCRARADSRDSSRETTLERLERITSRKTIAQQLEEAYSGQGGDNFAVQLVKAPIIVPKKPKKEEISRKRNIRRQAYLDNVSKRDDSRTFATIGLFVLVPPLLILGAAAAAGYVQLLP